MKRIFFIGCFLTFTFLFTSCATTQTTKEKEVAGYNLKSKKEQMEQKILYSKNKTLLAMP
jgi:hypothetical protein